MSTRAVHTAKQRLADVEGRVITFRARLAELETLEADLLRQAGEQLAAGTEPNGTRNQRLQARLEREEINAALPGVEREITAARDAVAEAERAAALAELEALRKQAPKLDDEIEGALNGLVAALAKRAALIQPTLDAVKAAGVEKQHPAYGRFVRHLESWMNHRIGAVLYPGPTSDAWLLRYDGRSLRDLDASVQAPDAGDRTCRDCGLRYLGVESYSALQCPACALTSMRKPSDPSSIERYSAGAREKHAERDRSDARTAETRRRKQLEKDRLAGWIEWDDESERYHDRRADAELSEEDQQLLGAPPPKRANLPEPQRINTLERVVRRLGTS